MTNAMSFMSKKTNGIFFVILFNEIKLKTSWHSLITIKY
jgi:hypothetical protein